MKLWSWLKARLFAPPSLKRRLEAALGCAVHLEFEEQSQRRIFASPAEKGRLNITLDVLFDDPDDSTFAALVGFLKGGGEQHRQVLIDTLKLKREGQPNPVEQHPLQGILDQLCREHFPQLPYIEVVGGRVGKKAPQKSIRLASFWPSRKEVRIHPYVMDERVPKIFHQYLIYHELCHAWLMLSGKAKSGQHHGVEFYELEGKMPGIDQAKTWEKEKLQAFLSTAQKEWWD